MIDPDTGLWSPDTSPMPEGFRFYADFTGAQRSAEARKKAEMHTMSSSGFALNSHQARPTEINVHYDPARPVGALIADNDNRKPRLLVIGHGRHGKDTVAEILRDEHGFSFVSSSYFAGEKVVRPALAVCGITYASMEECYEDRVNWRAFWYEAIKAYNKGGKSRLAEEILQTYDMYVGMRSGAEYEASRGLFDYVLWVDARERGIALEPRDSFDIDFDSSMFLIDNNGSLEDLREEVRQFLAQISTKTTP